ncbi:MAG: SMI1/KNR4 family protein [Oscillatoriales cyanobacterium C42_A2020_001]|nr:SMI1/KNR4 family protein [Leptolyngbyaceae cyanobacterium C42_A2020_001]
MMYLDRAKEEYEEMLQSVKRPVYHEPCSSQDIEEIKQVLNLPLPGAYEEFLRWVGRRWDVADFPGGFYSTHEWIARTVAIEIMEENGATEQLPEDAIVFVICVLTQRLVLVTPSLRHKKVHSLHAPWLRRHETYW